MMSGHQKTGCIFLIPDACHLHSESGFTLVEMAVVLIIVGMIMLAVLPALTALRTGSQRSLTQTNLQALMTATAAYVQANGCLPCPASPTASSTVFGLVGTPANAACGTCAASEGIPPFMSLGIPASTAHDGWSYWITMRVDPALTANFGITPPTKPCVCSGPVNGPCTASSPACTCAVVNTVCMATAASIQGMCAANLSATGRINVLTLGNANPQKVAVIFVSHGSRGFGSFNAASVAAAPLPLSIPFPSSYASCGGGGYAECNAPGTAEFVNAPQMNSSQFFYDDVLAYADRNMIVSMLSGGSSCQTVW